mgnify:CR=1 FL=1
MDFKKYNNLVDLFFEQYKKQNKDKFFLSSLKEPKKNFSWNDVHSAVLQLANEISKIIKDGDRCLLISENRPEWMISDLSIMLAGGITVPAYTTYVSRDYEYIINDCSPSVLLVSNDEQFSKVKNICEKSSFIKKIFSFETLTSIDKNKYFNVENLIQNININENINLKSKAKRSDPACIIYTSGTQGNPKGVILSHGGILSNCEGGHKLLKPILDGETRFLTWLPLSHSYEHAVQFIQIAVGAKVFYAESIDKLIKNMSECSPHIMTAVPRFYQNLYQKINATFNKTQGFKRNLINNTIKLGAKKLRKHKMSFSEKVVNFIVEKLVRNKIKKQFGGSLKTFVSGGGALDSEIGTFLNAIGGLDTPTSGGVRINDTDITRLNSNELIDFRLKNIGFVFQAYNLIPVLTAKENVEFIMLMQGTSKDDRDKRSEDLLEAVGIADKKNRRPGQLSGGQQQRLCIARCLPTRPKILLMDEPCSALDPSDTDKVEELIRELRKDYTVVIVTHNLQQAGRISDQSVLFHLGKIIEAAPTADFFQNPKEKRTRDFITGRYG